MEGSGGKGKIRMNPISLFGMEKSPFFLLLTAKTNKMYKAAKERKNSQDDIPKAI